MPIAPVLSAALAGLALGLSLIIAIGAQNAFVLRQGIRREHVVLVVAICALSDLALIAVGVAGGGALFTAVPWLAVVARYGGALFLLIYGLLAARRALRRPAADAAALDPEAAAGIRRGGSVVGVALTTLALTWLNPHVYLDTVVLLGSIASTHGDLRWAFGAGAGVGSILWFSALGIAARALAPVFARPNAWRVLDGFVAVVMLALAVGLVVSA